MPPIVTDEVEAQRRIEDALQILAEPQLPSDAVGNLMTEFKVASVWAVSTAYQIGSVVVPTANNRNGRRFICIALDGDGVTSGTTEPDWGPVFGDFATISGALAPDQVVRDWLVTDGNLTWKEDGREIDLWDFNKAICKGWRMKAALVAGAYDASNASQSLSRSQMHLQCLEQIKLYGGSVVDIG